MITGLYTNGMPGWGTYGANHIVTIYGYTFNSSTGQATLSYVDTGSEYAGHHYNKGGAYFNSGYAADTVWGWVSSDDAQVW